jgi:hypothetical protein
MLSIDDAALLIRYAKIGYFAHHNLIFKWRQFSKRDETDTQRIFIDVPARIYNNNTTTWIDLSKKDEPVKQ